MSSNKSPDEPQVVRRDDPYQLTPEGIQEPPTTWRATLRQIGPGLIISAEIVGSGELIATTALGAQAGFALLWMVLVSTFVKVAIQVEFARWTISTGQPAITGFNKVPPSSAAPVGSIFSWSCCFWRRCFSSEASSGA
ncbi:Nramp family divalent metal transporter [Saccharopolyspora halophila]|uniref:Nramp family divalent metal transporter n=1 Tax=Saccharopolyspora halophila TaxID=405551 RepID=UPI0031D0C341